VDYCGLYSGKKRDKSKILQAFYGVLGTVPHIQECPLNHECKVIHSLDLGGHTLVVEEIIQIMTGCFKTATSSLHARKFFTSSLAKRAAH
jgi:flavin reductase (DIM6/NTAB) family NADH-FMN oxidoreductase RutF